MLIWTRMKPMKMRSRLRILLRLCLTLACAAAGPLPAATAPAQPPDTSAGNLLVVLRESRGENKQDESLKPFGKMRVTLSDGHEVELETSWYQYLGDMHIRLVFDG